ncbi:hypothetical protein NPS70_08330 [Streptomyces sp. C10-9-1]|uniref:hypothetical protein n=1 Tax=unclassified Streptomyces TaxID=2593676 RepID=UPI0021113914|nr:hypothetical protein [Streptomyces sp. C10-9-1]MCQ6553196.1 hypothetical protein [Streptomyces sp. C10-9-1]
MSEINEPTPEETPGVESEEEAEVEAHSVRELQDLSADAPGDELISTVSLGEC